MILSWILKQAILFDARKSDLLEHFSFLVMLKLASALCLLLLSVEAFAGSPLEDKKSICAGSGFGMSKFFSGIFKNSFLGRNSNVEGRLATGGDADIENYGIGDGLFDSSVPSQCPTLAEGTLPFANYTLIVGGKLRIDSSRIFYGGVLYGEDDAIEISEMDIGTDCPFEKSNETARHVMYAWDDLVEASNKIHQLGSRGGSRSELIVPTRMYRFRMKGNTDFEMFTVQGSDLERSNGLRLVGELQENATIIIRVVRSSISRTFNFIGKEFYGKFDAYNDRILWSFSSGFHNINLSNLTWHGSILAVNANIRASYGQVYGSVFAKSWSSEADTNTTAISYVPFKGQVPEACTKVLS
jgi:choice-of-anchor A domain-containing protein